MTPPNQTPDSSDQASHSSLIVHTGKEDTNPQKQSDSSRDLGAAKIAGWKTSTLHEKLQSESLTFESKDRDSDSDDDSIQLEEG
ncbi:hypothetical protein F503_03947 [Ophiostoma piceae UAMH 11346]|uniref:Uncharacterized protein n=1 Tax=Ophiostoma piceae (strain UAMH 11346) TaxID=1262450 RepID=S3BPP7_OPHP1|nr:hypothetical protein F503_03947 [Ophiostoma piceae UAMH 11346]